MERNFLRIDSVSCRFGATQALGRIGLAIARGAFVAIVGASGCGKSTLFNIIAGLLQPSEGRVLLDGADVTGQPGQVGYMLQKDLLLPWRSVLENIVLGAAMTRGVTRADRAAAAALAHRYGLGPFLHHYPHALSGGMRQRAALLRTVAHGRPLMLLDEPFGALDAQTRLDMQQFLLGVWADLERTILFVTHDIDEALYLADRVVVMTPRPGRIAAEIALDLPRPRTLATLTDSRLISAKREILRLLHPELLAA